MDHKCKIHSYHKHQIDPVDGLCTLSVDYKRKQDCQHEPRGSEAYNGKVIDDGDQEKAEKYQHRGRILPYLSGFGTGNVKPVHKPDSAVVKAS